MKLTTATFLAVILVICVTVDIVSGAWGDKMKLEDLKVITLKEGRMTTGRRSPPVPQLKCVGNCVGTLPASAQCVNRGWDGMSVQWECKADFQDGYRFGDLEVVCEGYDYPDDPYILVGSCGLEYTVQGTGHGDKASSYGWQQDVLNKPYKKKSGFEFGDILFLLVLAGVVYALYVTCIARNNADPSRAYSTTNDDYPPDDRQAPNAGWNIPGMGGARRRGFGGGVDGAACGQGAQQGGGGGFWTGLATGGLMGYMFGNRGGYQNQGQYYRQPTYSTGSSFFGQSQPSYGSSSSSSTSTGFASTRRR